jgi:hypothetical protein
MNKIVLSANNNKLTLDRFGSGSLSQSLLRAFPSLDAEVIFPLRISSTKSLSTDDWHMAKHRST